MSAYKTCPECGVIYGEEHGAFAAGVCPARHGALLHWAPPEQPPELIPFWPKSDRDALAAMAGALLRYGGHTDDCAVYGPCDCGWDEMSGLAEKIGNPVKSALREGIEEIERG